MVTPGIVILLRRGLPPFSWHVPLGARRGLLNIIAMLSTPQTLLHNSELATRRKYQPWQQQQHHGWFLYRAVGQ